MLRGQRGDWPMEEGHYPLPREPGAWTAGDVDGDGDADAVVFVEDYQGAGVFVLSNLTGERMVGAGISPDGYGKVKLE